ncbi:hypothetical protein OKIT_1378 [Oenococcus kitaharae DSM 17330]|uniref:Pore-forming protein n=2 Tax=Lactobacillaceae TaxID=33958 RepID=G9WFT8_9LACO|nr:hypothetical protein OKIT_1378 [Oenococcus kitaharae DSM 17330]
MNTMKKKRLITFYQDLNFKGQMSLIWLGIFVFITLIVQLEFSRLAFTAFVIWAVLVLTLLFYFLRLRLLIDDDHILFQSIFVGNDLEIDIKNLVITRLDLKKRLVEFNFEDQHYRIWTSKKAINYFQKIEQQNHQNTDSHN